MISIFWISRQYFPTMRWNKKIAEFNKKHLKKPINEAGPSTTSTIAEQLNDCCICLETNVLESQKTPCGHCVCTECQDQMRKPVCPMCRADIPLSEAARALIESERTERLKWMCYARIFRAIDAEYVQYVEMMNEDSDNVEGNEWEDVEITVSY